MSKRAHITIKTFNAVKILLEGGASIKEAADFMGISEMSAKRIKASKDFDEYKSRSSGSYYIAKRKAMEKAEKEKKQEEKPAKVVEEYVILPDNKMPGGTITASYQLNRLYEQMKSLNDTMTLISNKLTAIVDELIN